MQKQILIELKELRLALSKILGTSDLPASEKFSITSLNKAAAELKKMQVRRREWVPENEIYKYVKNAGWSSDNFIRSEFHFSNFFKDGRVYYYNKNDLIALSKDLKDRNVNLSKYIELKGSETSFKKKFLKPQQIKNYRKNDHRTTSRMNFMTLSQLNHLYLPGDIFNRFLT